MFYVYEWFIKETNEIIYVGKGNKKRYLVKKHNQLFQEFIKRYNCESRIIKYFEKEEDAFRSEYDRIEELKAKGQCVCNIRYGGFGGETKTWSEEKRKKYSENNIMKSQIQRDRMKKNNPMYNKEVALKNGLAHHKALYIGGKEYQSLAEAANQYKRTSQCIFWWLKSGKNPLGEKCYYKHGNQQPNYTNTLNSSIEGSTTNE